VVRKPAVAVEILFCLFACAKDQPQGPISPEDPPADRSEVDVTAFGARANDNVDDTNAFASAIRALPETGGTVVVAPGVYLLSAFPKDKINRAIDLSGLANVTITGAGPDQTTLRMAPASYKGDTHVILVERSNGITIRDLTIDGNRFNVAYNDEQSHGVDIHGGSDIRFVDVDFIGMHGDGIRLLGLLGPTPVWVDGVWVERCSFAANGRSGIAIQRAVRGVTVTGSTFTQISDQSIDMEPTGGSQDITQAGPDIAPRDLIITNNRFHDTASLSLTITGLSVDDPARNIRVADNEFEGTGIFVFNAEDVRIEGNMIRSGEKWAPIEVRKGSESIWIVDNVIDSRSTEKASIVLMFHTSRAPRGIRITNNTIQSADHGAFYSRDADDVWITGNSISGSGDHGILVQDIAAGSPLSRFLIESNELQGFSVGVAFSSRGDETTDVCVRENEFVNVDVGIQTEGPIIRSCVGF
jgi:polygalacturonase